MLNVIKNLIGTMLNLSKELNSNANLLPQQKEDMFVDSEILEKTFKHQVIVEYHLKTEIYGELVEPADKDTINAIYDKYYHIDETTIADVDREFTQQIAQLADKRHSGGEFLFSKAEKMILRPYREAKARYEEEKAIAESFYAEQERRNESEAQVAKVEKNSALEAATHQEQQAKKAKEDEAQLDLIKQQSIQDAQKNASKLAAAAKAEADYARLLKETAAEFEKKEADDDIEMVKALAASLAESADTPFYDDEVKCSSDAAASAAGHAQRPNNPEVNSVKPKAAAQSENDLLIARLLEETRTEYQRQQDAKTKADKELAEALAASIAEIAPAQGSAPKPQFAEDDEAHNGGVAKDALPRDGELGAAAGKPAAAAAGQARAESPESHPLSIAQNELVAISEDYKDKKIQLDDCYMKVSVYQDLLLSHQLILPDNLADLAPLLGLEC